MFGWRGGTNAGTNYSDLSHMFGIWVLLHSFIHSQLLPKCLPRRGQSTMRAAGYVGMTWLLPFLTKFIARRIKPQEAVIRRPCHSS